jgi:hypothetical protein
VRAVLASLSGLVIVITSEGRLGGPSDLPNSTVTKREERFEGVGTRGGLRRLGGDQVSPPSSEARVWGRFCAGAEVVSLVLGGEVIAARSDRCDL